MNSAETVDPKKDSWLNCKPNFGSMSNFSKYEVSKEMRTYYSLWRINYLQTNFHENIFR